MIVLILDTVTILWTPSSFIATVRFLRDIFTTNPETTIPFQSLLFANNFPGKQLWIILNKLNY